MGYRLEPFSDVGLNEALLGLLLDELHHARRHRLEKLWTYYRNALEPNALAPDPVHAPAGRWYRQPQELGLPARIAGRHRPFDDDRAALRREIVVENDIAWRIHTMVDFLFGKPARVFSTARDERTRRDADIILDTLWNAWGGPVLLQDAALLAHVYGHVDLALRADEPALRAPGTRDAARVAEIAAEALRLDVIEPTRGVAVLDPDDYRRINAFIIDFDRDDPAPDRRGPFSVDNLADRLGLSRRSRRERTRVTEVLSGTRRQRYEAGRLVLDAPVTLFEGRTPVVHIQNLSQPFVYSGLSEVEPLIPLQDELNTRLSDRANRVTLQSFKMYLAKGIDGFEKSPIGPGRVWSTDNMDASIEAFGGDASSPSEDRHVDELREAMDKVSAVPPVAAGVVRAKLGSLSSATALRVTLMGLMSKTHRKRVTYGAGLERLCRLALTALDSAGLFPTDPRDRGVRVEWPDPMPVSPDDALISAERKLNLGVASERVLSELGYTPADAD